MEDVTDPAFRALCKRYGADRVYTEFVNADALVRDIASTTRKLTIHDAERPVAIQIYGKDPESMAEAAKIVEQAHPDVIDINFGCPVKKVAGKGAGAGLLRDVPKMLEIAKAVVNAVSTPVTAKTRLGWDEADLLPRVNPLGLNTPSLEGRGGEGFFIVELAEALQDCGIQELAIHGRTRSQMYRGEADWTLIGEVKNNPRMHIPIIGNGDITSAEEAKAAFERYGVDGVMVGRATFGRPWIFREMRQLLDGTPDDGSMDLAWKIGVLKEQLLLNVERIDEYRGILHTRRHLAATPVFKGIPNFRPTRIALLRAETVEEVTAILDDIQRRLTTGEGYSPAS